jgi:general secretion pathway protein D
VRLFTVAFIVVAAFQLFMLTRAKAADGGVPQKQQSRLVNAEAVPAPWAPPSDEIRVDLSGATVIEVIETLYSKILTTPYVISPKAYEDQRRLSVRIVAPTGEARAQAERYIRAIGYRVRQREGVETIVPAADDESETVVYRPVWRTASYLNAAIRPVLGAGQTAPGQAPGVSEGASSQATSADSGPDIFIYRGSHENVARVKRLLVELDTPPGTATIEAHVFEVSSDHDNGSAVKLAVAVASKRYGVDVTLGQQLGQGQAIKLSTPQLDAVISALSSDNHFRTMDAPLVKARSGEEAEFTAGQQTPTLGNVAYAGASGTAVQSVQYRDSGVIFRVKPTIRGTVIDLDVAQELSAFAATTNGVNTSPTLNKRAVKSSLSMRSGETVLLAGLRSRKTSTQDSGLLGLLPLGREVTESETEIVVILTARVDRSPTRPDARLLEQPRRIVRK